LRFVRHLLRTTTFCSSVAVGAHSRCCCCFSLWLLCSLLLPLRSLLLPLCLLLLPLCFAHCCYRSALAAAIATCASCCSLLPLPLPTLAHTSAREARRTGAQCNPHDCTASHVSRRVARRPTTHAYARTSTPDPATVNQLFDAASQLGLDRDVLDELLPRSTSTSSQNTAWTPGAAAFADRRSNTTMCKPSVCNPEDCTGAHACRRAARRPTTYAYARGTHRSARAKVQCACVPRRPTRTHINPRVCKRLAMPRLVSFLRINIQFLLMAFSTFGSF
jgi:hypothetical protein